MLLIWGALPPIVSTSGLNICSSLHQFCVQAYEQGKSAEAALHRPNARYSNRSGVDEARQKVFNSAFILILH